MKKLFIIVPFVILIFVLGTWIFSKRAEAPNGDPSKVPASATTTLSGVFTCLPHRNTSGPQTLECAFGMKVSEGEYYALDFSGLPQSTNDRPMNRLFHVTGLLVPIEAMSSDMWQRYNIKGIMKVSSLKEDEGSIPVAQINSKITLELNKKVKVADTTLIVTAVTQDSRCPSDVQCIQAGKVSIAFSATSPSGTSSAELEIGKSLVTKGFSATLLEVTPYPTSKHKTADFEYRFVFETKSI